LKLLNRGAEQLLLVLHLSKGAARFFDLSGQCRNLLLQAGNLAPIVRSILRLTAGPS
jgi:hypothetical protein